MLSKEMTTTFNLKQATCTIDEKVFWAEHIGGDNESREYFGHIPFESSVAVADEDESSVQEEKEEEDFCMD